MKISLRTILVIFWPNQLQVTKHCVTAQVYKQIYVHKHAAASLLHDIILVHCTFKKAILDTGATHYHILSSGRNSPCHQFCKDKNEIQI